MTIAEELHALADAANNAAAAAAAQAVAATKDAALTKLRTAANTGAYSLVLKPGGASTGYSQAVIDYLKPYLEGHGLTVAVQNVPETAVVDFALLCNW